LKQPFWEKFAKLFIQSPFQIQKNFGVIREYRLKGFGRTWVASNPIPLIIKQTERVLVIDVVRDITGPIPSWDAVILIEEKLYTVSVEALVLDKNE